MILKPRPFRKPNYKHPLCPDIAFWLMNEGNGNIVADLSKNNYQGTEQTDSVWRAGLFGPARYFSGDDFLNCGDIVQLNSASAFTIYGWFNQTAVNQREGMFSKVKDGDEQIYVVTWNDNNLYTQIERPSPNDAYGSFAYTSVGSDNWWHYALVFDGSGVANADRLKVYINAQIQTLAFTNTIPTTTADLSGQDFLIGKATAATPRFWVGLIDHMGICSRPLSLSDIQKIYINPFIMFDRDLVELWTGATSVGVPVGAAGIMTTNPGIWGPTF